MEKLLYVMLIERGENYRRMTKAVAERHVGNIKKLDDGGLLHLCGITKGLKGVAGMIILKAESLEAAEEICRAEPLVVEGFATYKLITLKVADKENNYLLK